MIRDEEIKRLIKYAEGLGLRVVFSKSRSDDAAAWTTDGSEITIYSKNQGSKTEMVLSLVHELGHQLWYIHEKNRKPDLKFEQALDRQNLYEVDIHPTPPSKALRERIYKIEEASTHYWEVIYKDTGLKFPLWKLKLAMELDLWMYGEYVKTGHFPKRKEKKNKKKELKLKYGKVRN